MASLTTLPLEVQVRMLEFCLVSEAPIVYNCGYPLRYCDIGPENEIPGQDEICSNVLATCQFYHRHGLDILLKKNTFRIRQGLANPYVCHPFWRPSFASVLRHVTIRYRRCFTYETPLYIALDVLNAVEQAPSLQTLQIDLVATRQRAIYLQTAGPQRDPPDGAPDVTRWQCRRFRHRPSFATGQLKRIILTGLESTHGYLIAAQILATLLYKQGTIGIGINAPSDAFGNLAPRAELKGSRYVDGPEWFSSALEPIMRSFGKTGVNEWIKKIWMELGETEEYMYDDYRLAQEEPEDPAQAAWLDLLGISGDLLSGFDERRTKFCWANPVGHVGESCCFGDPLGW